MDVGLPAGGVAVETSSPAESVLLITVRGEIDVLTIPPLEQALERAWQKPRPRLVLLDLSAVGFFGSVGIRAIVRAEQSALVHGVTLGLCRPSRAVRRALSATSVDRILRFYDSPEAALSYG